MPGHVLSKLDCIHLGREVVGLELLQFFKELQFLENDKKKIYLNLKKISKFPLPLVYQTLDY